MSFAKYLKAAFLNHWNMLAVLGGVGFGVLSGAPDVVLPLVAAAEMTYLGLLGSHPKFQKYVDAQEAKATRQKSSETTRLALNRIVRSLPRPMLNRFESLRAQCVELRQIASQLRHSDALETAQPLDDFQVSGLDRLLWIYLRLLYTQFALERFLEKTDERSMQQDMQRLEKRLAQTAPAEPGSQADRVRKTLEDNLATSQVRIENLRKAQDNYELVKLEIDRLENKIRSLSEMAINRHEPDFISSQVDQVASSMMDTERTMNELQFATGLHSLEDETPELLELPRLAVKH